jgi:hypothetical protein
MADAALYVGRLVFAAVLLTVVLFRTTAAALHVVRGDSERAPNFFGTAVFAYLLLADLITFLK